MKTALFICPSYRDFLHHEIKSSGRRGFKTRLAEAADCQQSRMTQVLNGTAQLNEDQALGICEFLRLTDAESDFFILLVRYERASSEKLRDHLKAKMMRVRSEVSKSHLADH
jgi:hypothetical protein